MARSNRALTQFAVNKLRDFILNGYLSFQDETQGNTSVAFEVYGLHEADFVVKLFGKPILAMNDKIIRIQYGDFCDSRGLPSSTTRERLNGLLDELGTLQVIPEGVRVYVENDRCYVGKGQERRPLDRENEFVLIETSPKEFYVY